MTKRGSPQNSDANDGIADVHSRSSSLLHNKDELAEVVLAHIAIKYNISVEKLLLLLSASPSADIGSVLAKRDISPVAVPVMSKPGFPVALFAVDSLSGLEIVVKFLHEEKDVSITDIGTMLNRSPKTVWATYSVAKKKCPARFDVVSLKKDSDIEIPFEVLADRKLSILESIVFYLNSVREIAPNRIAEILHRNVSTVWTVFNRSKKKMSEGSKSERSSEVGHK